VGLKIEIHEIQQNIRNPVSTNRNPLPKTKSNTAERKLNIEIQRKLPRNQRLPRKPELLTNSTHSTQALMRTNCMHTIKLERTIEMTRSQRLPACRRYRKSSAAVVAPSSVTSRDYHKMSRRTRPSTATSTCLSSDHLTTSGNAARADPESDGSTRSGRQWDSPGGPVEACDYSWSPRSNATALAG